MPARDLYVTSFAPQLENGRALRTYALVRALAAAGPLDVAYVPFGGDGPSAEFAAVGGVDYHRIVPSRGVRRAVTFARMRAQGVSRGLARGTSPELLSESSRLADERGRGRVIAGDLTAMTALLPLARRRPVVYSAHNVESSFTDPIYGGPVARRLVAVLERRVLRTAEESWMVSRADIDLARGLLPGARLRYVPNVVDAEAIVPVTPSPASAELLMVGDFTWPPNLSGLRWLNDAVLPLVAAEIPGVRIRVVGRGLGDDGVWDERLDRLGFVDDLRDAYTGVAAVVVPLIESGGTPLKFIEALAYGVPVVATQRAAHGLDVVDGEHFRCATEPAAFAAALVDLLRAGDPAMAARARALVEREYSIATLTRLVSVAGDQPPVP